MKLADEIATNQVSNSANSNQPVKSIYHKLGRLGRLGVLFHFDNKLQLLLARIFWPSRGAIFYHLNGLEVLIDHGAGDQDGTRSCLYPGLYDPILRMLGGGTAELNVLDLGANGGGFLLALAHHGFTIKKAVAVELNPHTWSRLVLNSYRNIPGAPGCLCLLNGAATGSDGTMQVRLGRGSVSDSISGGCEGSEEEFTLPAYSLETLLGYFSGDQKINLCKIDIEGAEYQLLRNVDPGLLNRVESIVIEIHEVANEESNWIHEWLRGAGYTQMRTGADLIEPNVFFYSRSPSIISG